MRFTFFTTIFSLFALSLSSPTLSSRQTTLAQITDSYVFSVSLGQFIANRNARTGPATLDWSSDGCSSSPDNPFGFNCKYDRRGDARK
jgi:hypothetical protein